MNVSKLASPTNVGEILTHFCLNCRFFCLFSLSPKSRLSGFQLPSSIVSTGSLLTLWFTTDFAVSAQGFKAMYEGRRLPRLASHNRTCCWGMMVWMQSGRMVEVLDCSLIGWQNGMLVSSVTVKESSPKTGLSFPLVVWIWMYESDCFVNCNGNVWGVHM